MHHSTKRRVLGMTTGGLLVGGLGMGIAQADTAANGATAHSPGLLSGNLIQIPVNAPVNVCGNSISVVGILDSATGNSCADKDSNGAAADGGATNSPGVGSGNLIQVPVDAPINLCGDSVNGVGVGDTARDDSCSNGSHRGSGSAGSSANGGSGNSPGIGSGNTIQLPVTAPVNVCGDSVSVIGIGDTAAGNSCSNGPATPTPCDCQPTRPVTPPATPSAPRPPAPPHHVTGSGRLAETGSGAAGLATPLGAGVLGGGGLLLRRRMPSLQHLTGGRKN
jgi:hypothetical protein